MQCFQFNKKAQCLFWDIEFNVSEFLIMLISTIVHRAKCLKHGTKSLQRGTKRPGSGRPPPPAADHERVRLAFHNSPTLSVRREPNAHFFRL
jgi:hypothetical protein